LGDPHDGFAPGQSPDGSADASSLRGRPAAAADGTAAQNADALLRLSVYEIDDNPFQPRRDFGDSEIASLAESLKEHDMLQPVLVRRVGDRYQLISGERRLRAAVRAGWSTVPARIREADDRLVAELAIVENLQRKDLNPIEKALSFRRYLEQHECTQEELAQRLKIDRSTIANLMRLLELPEEIIADVRTGKLSAGHARTLLPLGEEHLQLTFARRIQSEGWSVRETERLVSEQIALEDRETLRVVGSTPAPAAPTPRSRQLGALEQELRQALGTKVDIRQTARGRGKIVLHFTSSDEFDRLRALLMQSDATSRREAS
jgi:ParB family chromosome partitioning protein